MRIDAVRQQLQSALAQAAGDQLREALVVSLQLLDELVEVTPAVRSSRHAGSMVWTFEDENYEPYGRQIDVRIDYDWDDYDAADAPFVSWGPTIADVAVLAVRYLDEDGNDVSANVHYTELAWDLVNKHHEQMIDLCTEHGYQHGVGKSPITYRSRSTTSTSAPTSNSEFVPRLAPSEPTRASQQNRRQFG